MLTKYDKYAGYVILAFWGILICYLTIWMILLPFVDSDSPVTSLFLPQKYALILPGLFFVIGTAFVGWFAVVHVFGREKLPVDRRSKRR